jgi:hypothetical protein
VGGAVAVSKGSAAAAVGSLGVGYGMSMGVNYAAACRNAASGVALHRRIDSMRPETRRLLAAQRGPGIILGCFILSMLGVVLLPPQVAFVVLWILAGLAFVGFIIGWRDRMTSHYRPRSKGEKKE